MRIKSSIKIKWYKIKGHEIEKKNKSRGWLKK